MCIRDSLGVNDHFTVFEAHCAIFTDIDTGTNAYTSALALSALEALVNSLLAGRTAGESCFAGSMSSACLLYTSFPPGKKILAYHITVSLA